MWGMNRQQIHSNLHPNKGVEMVAIHHTILHVDAACAALADYTSGIRQAGRLHVLSN